MELVLHYFSWKPWHIVLFGHTELSRWIGPGPVSLERVAFVSNFSSAISVMATVLSMD
jgi:hypothetical protein